MISQDKAYALISQCSGDEIWSVETCRQAGVPEAWIEEMADAFESGYRSDSQTIYVENAPTNQYHGVRDVDLAIRLGKVLGVDVDSIIPLAPSRQGVVRAIKEALME